MAPVTLGFKVAKIEHLLQAGLDAGDATRDLAGHISLAPDRALMIEQDAIRCIHAVRFAVVHRDPVAVKLRDSVR